MKCITSSGSICLILGTLGVSIIGFNGIASAADNEFLEMDISQLMQVTITSVSKKEQPLADAAAAVFVITQEDIRRSGVTHIAEALAMAPGLQVARINASKWSVSSRGFAGYTSNKLLVMIDGRTVYSPAYSGAFWDMQNTLLEDIDRIEVIRGPGGTLWGANAVNGVINIITRNSSEVSGGLVRVGAGDQESLQGGARYGGKINDSTNGRIYATYNDRDSNTLADVGGASGSARGSANDGWQSFQSGFRFDGELHVDSEWTFQGDIYKNREDQILFPYWLETPPYLTQKYTDLESSGGNILGRFRREFSTQSALTVQAYYDYNDRDDALYRQTYNTFDIEIQYERDFGNRNSITLGGGFRQIDGEFENSYQLQIDDRNDQLYSAFFQDELMLLDDELWLTFGIKGEHNDFTGYEWQPSARLLWKPVDLHTVWASVARAVRTPSALEHGGAVVAASYPTPMGTMTSHLHGNKDFASEVALAYEAGYRWLPNAVFSLDIAGFYNDYQDLYSLALEQNGQNDDLILVNGVNGESYGVEVAGQYQPTTWLSFNLAYSYLEMDLATADATNDTEAVPNFIEKASPQHQISLRSSVALVENWQVNFWLRYVDEITARNRVNFVASDIPVDDYFVFDLNLIWKATEQLEVMLVGQNLFSDGQLQYISEYTTPATEIEPSVYAKLTYHF